MTSMHISGLMVGAVRDTLEPGITWFLFTDALGWYRFMNIHCRS